MRLTQPILRPNSWRWNQREQGLRTAVAERVYGEALEDVAINTVNAFFDVYFAETSLRNANDNLARNDTLMKLAQARRNLGTNGESDVIRAELAVLNARTQRNNAMLDRERTLAALRTELGVAPGAPVSIVITPGFPSLEPDSALAAAEALRNRSEILSLESQETSARRRESEASLNYGIGGTVTASYGYNATANEFDLAYNDLLEARSFRLGVQVPIVQWGLRSAEKHAAQSDLAAVQGNMRLQRERLIQEASFAAVQVTQARQTVESAILADSLATLRYRIQYAEYLSGKLQSDNLYIAQDEKNRASEQVVQALRSFWTAYYRLRRAAMYDFEQGRRIR
jgi:outer membrane protein TolC